MYGINIALTLY